MLEFADVVHGKVALPEWLAPFIKLPEFLRLRGVRLSNVDSYQFKDFNGPMRWEHSIAVAFLAACCAKKRRLSEKETVHLVLSGLLHDVATPPFAHTAEYVLENFDHELETQRVLSARPGDDFQPDLPVYASQLPQFHKACKSLSSRLKIPVDPLEVGRIVVGEGELGFLIRGTIDLDNADNVVRSSMHLGIDVDRRLPLRIVEWLSQQEHRPTNLDTVSERCVREWVDCRQKLYHMFFVSSEEELGRQAFLQRLMRRAVDAGFPRRSLIWDTDDGLLTSLENVEPEGAPQREPELRELVQRYRLLESPTKIAEVDIETEDALRTLCLPHVVAWIESEISSAQLEAMVMVASRRYRVEDNPFLFPPAPGTLLVFKVGDKCERDMLPTWLQEETPNHVRGARLRGALSRVLYERSMVWLREEPWLKFTRKRESHVLTNLKHVGDWSFRLTRNDNVHPYPSTFVHAIPASLINALGLRGTLVIDPFGGTGHTAVEAVKYGAEAVSADSNSIACLAARARLTFLSSSDRERLRGIMAEDIEDCDPSKPPDIENLDKWFAPDTLEQMLKIRRYVLGRRSEVLRQFLEVCFSAIIQSCTGRRGEQNSYFADNTPLAASQETPPYQDALGLFLTRIHRNIDIVEQVYAFMEREGRDPQVELRRAKVLQLDARVARPEDYGVSPNSAGGIVTSPPYLCMTDYTLGQRLSYHWLAPDSMEIDFERELAPRRTRFRPEDAIQKYFEGLRDFAKCSAALLRRDGFLATVLGSPVAKSFKSANVHDRFDKILRNEGFELTWRHWRKIHWHRNQGYAQLKKERIAVHVFKG